MFIAYGSRQGASPQRGDMFIGQPQFFTHGGDECSYLFSPFFCQHEPTETCHLVGVRNHLVGRKAINMSLLWSEDAPHRSSIVVKKTRSCLLATQRKTGRHP
jgi:hypothetical protein